MSRPKSCALIVGDLTPGEFQHALAGEGLGLQFGPFAARIQAEVAGLDVPLYQLYSDYPLLSCNAVYSFHVRLRETRKWSSLKRKVRFSVDGRVPHEDMPADQALAVLEWGINLVIALRSHSYLMLHSAVLERAGAAIMLPAEPGHGKSTLCAAMAHSGWRLFSDEFGLICGSTGKLVSIPRPIALKNESIDIIREFSPDAFLGPSILHTRKGTVAHMKAPAQSVHRQSNSADVKFVVFPRWSASEPLSLKPITMAEGFMLLASNAFNYELLGETGFCAVRDILNGADCYQLVYSKLADAIDCLSELAGNHGKR